MGDDDGDYDADCGDYDHDCGDYHDDYDGDDDYDDDDDDDDDDEDDVFYDDIDEIGLLKGWTLGVDWQVECWTAGFWDLASVLAIQFLSFIS